MSRFALIHGAGRGRDARRIVTVLAAMAAAFAGMGGAAPLAQAQAQEVGMVRVVHGLRGVVADIYLDDTLVLPDFEPERTTEPIPVPAGDHVIKIRRAGAALSQQPLITHTVTVPAGFQGSLVAHLDREGVPTLSAFPDDVSAVPAGSARVVVRHAAAAEDINVLLNGQTTFGGLASKTEGVQVVGAGQYDVTVMPATGGSPVVPSLSLEYPDGTASFMYLIGSQSDGTLGWAAIRVGSLETPPAVIQTGDGSTSEADGTQPILWVAVAGVIAAAACVMLWPRSRRAASRVDE